MGSAFTVFPPPREPNVICSPDALKSGRGKTESTQGGTGGTTVSSLKASFPRWEVRDLDVFLQAGVDFGKKQGSLSMAP